MKPASSFGLSDNHLREIKKAMTTSLAPNQTLSVWIFGSRARGTHLTGSDIDLLVDGQPSLTERQIFEIQSRLEDTEVPYKFDLANRCDLAPSYRPNIESEKILLWELA